LLLALALSASLAPATRLRADEPLAANESRAEGENGLGLSIGVHVENGNHRMFRHFEPTTGEARRYDARVYGGIGVALGYDRPLAGHLLACSLRADYWRSLLLASAARRLGRSVDTTAQRIGGLAGLYLHPAATAGSASIGLVAGVAVMTFDFAMPPARDDADETMQLATGNYTLWSTGIGARLPLSELRLSIRGSHLLGLRTGAFGTREAQDRPHGVDGLAIVDYRLLPWLDVSARAGVTLLWLSLAPMEARPTDEPASVRDMYLAFGLGATAHL
jgi:hypothetical protein